MSIEIVDRDPAYAPGLFGPSPHLHPIENRILEMEKQGRGPREIAHTLGLSANEVSRRLEAIHRKLAPRVGTLDQAA